MTPRQVQLIDFLRDYIGSRGSSPSFQEMAAAIGVSSKARVFRLLNALEDQGLVRRVRGRVRSIELVTERHGLRTATVDEIRAELARRGLTLDALTTRSPQPLASGTASCAGDSCFEQVEPGKLFCRVHWFTLSRDLRDGILRAHARRDVEAYQQLVGQARDQIDAPGYHRVVERAA